MILVKGGRRGHHQGDALVGGAKQAVDAVGEMLLDAGGVIAAQLAGLGARFIVSGVDEVGGFAAGLGGEVPKGEYAGAHHEGDKFLLIGHSHVLTPFPPFFDSVEVLYHLRGALTMDNE